MEDLTVSYTDVRKLLATASGDVAMLYLYIRSGGSADRAARELKLSDSAVTCAAAVLRQLGMWPEDRRGFLPTGQRPDYTLEEIIQAKETDPDFSSLVEEVERLLAKNLHDSELRILLGFVRYLGMSPEVAVMVVNYCIGRNRRMGKLNRPSLHTIEKEAYAWAEQGIETLEDASAYILAENVRHSRLGQLMKLLQIHGRRLTAGEQKYADQWLQMHFDDSAIALAYERTCLNTGRLNWAYMNKILTRWHQAGWHTAQEVQSREHSGGLPKGGSGDMSEAELEAMRRMMEE